MSKFPLVSTQQGIWFADQVVSRKNTYLIAHAIELRGDIDARCLEDAIRTGLGEADTVTARYVEDETGLWQVMRPGDEAIPSPEHVDFREEADPMSAARRFMEDDVREDLPVDGGRALYRQVLIDLGVIDGVPRRFWYQRYHHVMLDGFSFTALTRRVADIYTALQRGEPVGPSPFGSVSAVIEERRAYEESAGFAADREFWSAYCRNLPACCNLSVRSGRSPLGGNADVIAHIRRLPPESLTMLEARASAHGLSVFDMLMATVAAYLFRISGETRQVLGVPFMRRMGSVAVNSTAPVVNVLPVCIDVDADASLLSLSERVKAGMRQTRRHQRYDAEQIQRDLGLTGTGRTLYGPVINYRMFDYGLRFGEVQGMTHHLATGPVDDIEFGVLIHDGVITFELRGESSLYNEADLRRHGERLAIMLDTFGRNETIPVTDLPVMEREEARLISTNSAGPAVERPPHLATIIDVFAAQAAETPEKTALIFEDTALSFAGLSSKVFRLARYLIAHGVGPGDIVAVALPRTEKAVIAMLAVLTSGASYMPLDLGYPPERLATMCDEARPRLVVTTSLEEVPEGLKRICLDDPAVARHCAACDSSPLKPHERRAALTGDTIAYIIFTSGSTGRPKGVMNSHGALLNLFLAHRPSIYLPGIEAFSRQHHGRALRAAHTHSFAFDSSWLQIFWMLHGQELHVIGEDLRRDAERLAETVDACGIDAMDLPPSFCTQLLNCGLMAPERHRPTVLLIGGEAASPALWTALRRYPELQAHNLYGPTEYTVDALRAPVHATEQPVIGHPIGNSRAHVLDDFLKPVPLGVAGELYLSGSGLAMGYLARPELTAQRFVADPFRPGEIMYRTGDRVRWNDAGEVEFLGRTDHQVKVRGHRIETTEIETALLGLPGIQAALVVAEAVNDSHRLLAYCTSDHPAGADRHALAQSLRRELRSRLPDYMIPAALVLLDAFPLTANGKIDRSRLPAPSVSVERPPSTPEEIAVCEAMAQVLKLPAVGLEHDFFALGGDSITAIALCAALRKRGFVLRPRDVFAGRDVHGMALAALPVVAENDRQEGADFVSNAEIAALGMRYGAVDGVAPVLATQKGMLFHTQLGDRAGSYNAFTRLDLRGPLDVARLRRAFDAVLRRHPQLGGVFDMEGREEPVLVIPKFTPAPGHLWPWEEHDLSGVPESERTAALKRIETIAVEREHIGPTFRRLLSATLVRLSDDDHILLIVIHHLMIDGWSTPLLLRDLIAAYRQDGGTLPALPVGYTAVVNQLVARDPAPDRKAWKEALEGVVATRLFDQATAAGTVEEYELKLPAHLTEALLSRARRQGITLNVLMQAVWATVLGSMAGRDDVVFGTPVAGRSASIDGLTGQIGLFLNTIPVRVHLKPDTSLWTQAKGIQARQAFLMEHDGLGLGDIQALAGGKPLFDTLLVVENYPDNDYLTSDIDGLTIAGIHNRGYSHYPLALLVLPGKELTILVENRGAIADPGALAERVAGLLETLAQQPDLPLSSLPVRTKRDRALAESVNATQHPLPRLTLRDLLLAQAGRTPGDIALIDSEHSLTFRQVRHQTLHLAARLRESGVRTGDTVAVALPRSARLSIALLAVIEAGGAFLPLDLSYPAERLSFMLEDAAPKAIITDTASAPLTADGTPRILFDALADASIEVRDLADDAAPGPQSPAYVLYTSGTTGKPKGAVISHGAIVNRLLWMQHQYPLGDGDVVLQKTPCGFDVSVWEFFWSYITGARLVMAPPDAHRDPAALIDLIDAHAVTTLHFVPSMLAIFIAATKELGVSNPCPSLRRVFCSGEALSQALAQDFTGLFSAELHNLYGPTEAAIDVTYAPASGHFAAGAGSVPIGLPVWNTELRILDHLLRPVAAGVAGELYLSGVQLALGYLGRPELTASRFVADPYAAGERMYRTGDVARWMPDGQVEYLGRTDHQIKIRGQRVELGEIEARIGQLPGVRQVVVQAVELGRSGLEGADERQLVAYIVPESSAAFAADRLGAALKAVLPAHMVPAAFVPLDSLPLSPNGKLDRKALPSPAASAALQAGGRPPAEGLESQIAAIFSDLLGRDFIGADEDFFAIGGHSLLAMRLAARIRHDLKRQVSVSQIMVMPTVAKLAEHLVAGELVGGMAKSGFEPVIRLRDGDGPPLICIYPASGVSWQYSVLSRYLQTGRPIIGLQSPRPQGPIAMSASIDEACDRQLVTLREIQPEGPYYLLGYSLGGTVAYGLAARLRRMGETVRFLGLLDTYPSEEHDWSDPEDAQANLGAEREQEQFINDAMADVMDEEFRREKEEMFGHIFENYRDSVALLSKARTPDYGGHVTLFVAGKSLPPGIDPDECWRSKVESLSIHHLPHCSHEDIISPASLEILGPLLNTLIENADGTGHSEPPRQAAE